MTHQPSSLSIYAHLPTYLRVKNESRAKQLEEIQKKKQELEQRLREQTEIVQEIEEAERAGKCIELVCVCR